MTPVDLSSSAQTQANRMADVGKLPSANVWTLERIARLEHLWTRGFSASEIARDLSVTRSAVLGKAWRLGLSRRAKKQKPGDLFVRQTLEEQLLWQLRTDLMAGVPRAALIERIDDMLHRPGVRKTRMWRPLSVPEHGSPQLRFIYEEANRAMMTLTHLARSAGIGVDTLKYWRRRDREPTLGNVEACMNALGYTLTPARKR